jgi:uncharacterized cofD-like protein
VWRWLAPGLRLKRYLLMVGLGLLALGASLPLELTRYAPVWTRSGDLLIGVLLLGLALVVVGSLQLVRSLAQAFDVTEDSLARMLLVRRRGARGPRVVAVGGGTGLPALLRGLKEYTANLTAIVTMADDGGSSGRLRDAMGMLPPGDLRNCLVALADAEPQMRDLFQYRFQQGELTGHSFGNLFIAAMRETTGDFVTALRTSSRVLAVRGDVFPATLDSVALVAELVDGTVRRGESSIGRSPARIRRVWLEPSDAAPPVEAVRAIMAADLLVLGPGSLYTSVIPSLLIGPIAEAVRQTKALTVYAANVMTQPGETDGYTAYDHLKAIEDHVGPGVVDAVLINDQAVPTALLERYRATGAEPVAPGGPFARRVAVVEVPLLEVGSVVRHDPDRLARAVLRLLLRLRPDWARRRPWEGLMLEQRLRQAQEGGSDGLVPHPRGEGGAKPRSLETSR